MFVGASVGFHFKNKNTMDANLQKLHNQLMIQKSFEQFKPKKIFPAVLGILFLAVILVWTAVFYHSDSKLRVKFLDVGQGDSIFIKTPKNQKILIDGGPDSTVLEKLGENLPFYDRTLDLVILTHPHADHLVGLIYVLERYNVKMVAFTGATHTTDEYLEWLNLIKKKKIPVKIVYSGVNFDFGDDCKLITLYPFSSLENERVDSLNNSSIVCKLVYKNNSFLLSGDIEEEAEKEILDQKVDIKADVLKVAHQGSKTSSSEDFLKAVDSRVAVIMVGEENKFGHPHKQVLESLEALGINFLRTDKNGDIEFVSDGEKIYLK